MDDLNTLIRRNRELSILNIIAADLNREVDLARTLEITLGHVVELCGMHTGWVWLLDSSGDATLAASYNLPPALVSAPERMRGTCYCLDCYRSGAMTGADNIGIITCTRLKPLIDGTDGLRFHASVPLYAHGRPLGVLNVASPDWERISPDELRILSIAGDLLSIAIERARLFAHSAEIGAVEERNRIARDIHDTLAQNLAAITLKLEVADLLLENGAAVIDVRTRLNEALDLARQSLDDARRSVLDLRDAPLEGQGLASALQQLATKVTAESSIVATATISGDDRQIPLRTIVGLYRIAQEAVTNTIRHTKASQLELNLTITEHQIALQIIDNGQGFDPERSAPGHFGLVGMHERARLIGATLQIASSHNQGTHIVIDVPQ